MNYDVLLQSIVALHREAVGRAATAVNQSLILRNWLIGAHLVEFEQTGEDRAAYGERLLERISGDLKRQGVRGLSVSMLRNCRLVYRLYPQLRHALSGGSSSTTPPPIRQSPIGESEEGVGISPLATNTTTSISSSTIVACAAICSSTSKCARSGTETSVR